MFAHVPVAIAIQLVSLVIGRFLQVPTRPALWLGAYAGVIACIFREIAQHEYRWIEAYGHGLRANMPVLEGLKFWDWNRHSIEETTGAILAVVIVAVVGSRWGRKR